MATAITVVCFLAAAALTIAAAIEDVRDHRLRNIYTVPLIVIALVGLPIAAVLDDQTLGEVVVAMAIGAGWFAGPWLITHLVAPTAIGFGDIKLATGLGLFLGWIESATGFVGFFATSIIFGLTTIATKAAAREPLPFGPALGLGAAIAAGIGIA